MTHPDASAAAEAITPQERSAQPWEDPSAALGPGYAARERG